MNDRIWTGEREEARESNSDRRHYASMSSNDFVVGQIQQRNLLADNSSFLQQVYRDHDSGMWNADLGDRAGTMDRSMWPDRHLPEVPVYEPNLGSWIDSNEASTSWAMGSDPVFPLRTSSKGTVRKDPTVRTRKTGQRFETVTTSTRATESHCGRLTVELENGIKVAAIHHRILYPDHQKLNQTTYQETAAALEIWDVDESGERPTIVYEMEDRQDARTRVVGSGGYIPWRDSQGRVVVNSDRKPLRASEHLPDTVSTKIEGWRMELIRRLDPSVTWDDFLDRMPDATSLFGKTCASSLQSRRRKDINIFDFETRSNSRGS